MPRVQVLLCIHSIASRPPILCSRATSSPGLVVLVHRLSLTLAIEFEKQEGKRHETA